MRLWRKNGDRVLMVGIFHGPEVGPAVLKNICRGGFRRVAVIRPSARGRARVEQDFFLALRAATAGSLIGLAAGLFAFWREAMLEQPRSGELILLSIAFALAGAVAGWIVTRMLRQRVDGTSLTRCTSTILPEEAMVLAEVKADETSRLLTILRNIGAAAPVTFAFRSPRPFPVETSARAPDQERPSSQRVAENAGRLAHSMSVSRQTRPRGPSFLSRLRETEHALEWANGSLTMSAEVHHAFTLSAEWLLDNAYLIREQVTDLRRSLPEKYYGELPLIASGPEAGLPRVYHLASEMVAESAGALDPNIIQTFLVAFQAVTPLDIGELWALPLMLRLQLLESLRGLALQVEQQQSQSEEADFWANRLIGAGRRSSSRLLRMMEALVERYLEPTAHFASELVAHLYDEETVLPMVSGWLERHFRAPLVEIIQQEHRRQAGQQTALADAIGSCRRLAHVQWRELFQATSWAENELAADPAGIYSQQDFETRDRCRSAVEEIARWSKCSEQTIIDRALALAKAATDEVAETVAYYLLDAGRPALEQATAARVPLGERARRWLRADAAVSYFASVFVLTVAMVAIPLAAIAGSVSSIKLALLGFLVLLPASDLAVLAVNYCVTSFLPPQALPKISFKKEGIPDDCRTLVVVPTLLTTPGAIQSELNRLEIRYLGNTDANLRFSLLTDFADAPRQSMPEDTECIDMIARGIEELNRRHGSGHFFLFHRGRSWSESEQRWIGWERKRGKLEQLNRFLVGESAPELEGYLCAGDRAQLEGIRFVITLDADTQLLRDTARRMIETLAHPLNQARLSPDGRRVIRGYTIIQPSVSTSLPSASATWFSRIFADPRGIDPYTHAVSDVYQDLVGEGSYHGKAIYELRTFHRLLSGRFPTAHLLSHDLLEGSYVGVGLATDIELLDVFPTSYIAWWSRQHRWIRGDWQIIDWLKPHVPVGGGRGEPNPLSAFNRWKIFDNLRRSLVPPATFALLLAGWCFTSAPLLWTGIIAGLLLWPVLNSLLSLLFHPPPPGTRFWREPRDRLLRSLFAMLFLPDYAGMALDAIVRVAYRRIRSHRLLLEWETAQDAHQRAKNRQRQFVLTRLWIPATCALILAGAAWWGTSALMGACPFLILWALFPVAVILIDRPARTWRGGILTADDRRFLRGAARRTWRYFDDFVGPQTSWLPPDNVQETPTREIFLRTSPTNIGLWMLATVAANDFGYITIDDMVTRNLGTLEIVDRLERFEGHLLNWYDLNTLQPLHPRYVSTVDSGNLLASLWTFERSCDELATRPVLDTVALRGLADTLRVFRQVTQALKEPADYSALLSLEKLTADQPANLEGVILRLRAARAPTEELLRRFPKEGNDPRAYWAQQISKQVTAWNAVVDKYLRPVEILMAPPAQLMSLGDTAHECRREALAATFSLRNIVIEGIPGLVPLLAFHDRREQPEIPPAVREWLNLLVAEVEHSRQRGSEQLARLDELIAQCRQLEGGMGLQFLYDEERRIFAIGYQVAERRLDTSFYDLLASEARLTSFLAIARGEVPVEHWWVLSRPFGSAYGRLPLLSWNGTMFEYLMPLLFTQTHENSLLDRACYDAVHCQIAYAQENNVPWGISESAFSALDRHNVYQYRAFGVPALALKRGQGEDLVVAPYAAALALGVEPTAATKNLRQLAIDDSSALLGDYGYFEAIDYSRRTEPGGAAGISIHCYMAHHQGMSLLAYDNALNGNTMRRRFLADPRVRATEPLLHEHIPEQILPTTGEAHEERPVARSIPIGGPAVLVQTPDLASPRIQLLCNGKCSATITSSGGGGLRWLDLDITRWHADATCEVPGQVCYIHDLENDTLWSNTHQPVPIPQRRYTWSFTSDKAEFRRRSGPCETITEIVISAEDDAEVRRVTLVNTSHKTARLELTSYLELALAPHRADRAHPAFSKLFIETEWVPHCQALVARRRLRATDDRPVWVAHLMVVESSSVSNSIEFETDRTEFLGRGRTLENPDALRRRLTNRVGAVLDPILSLRRGVTILPNQRFQFALVTLVAESREAVIGLAERYCDFHTCGRAFETAWTHSQLEMRRLRIRPGDVQTYQQLAAFIIFPQPELRPPHARLSRRTEGQRALWRQGISGDVPIVVVMISHLHDIEVVREILSAHTFWNLRGLKVDLVLVSEEPPSYEEPLTANLQRLAEGRAALIGMDRPGGIYVRSASKMSKEETIALQAAARMVLIAARGTLRQQLASTTPIATKPKLLSPGQQFREEPSAPLAFMKLNYFNGLGGFTQGGKEFVIYLGPGRDTPLAWVNIIANPKFGTLVSEAGAEFVWGRNSQTERLTPWFNDPISDPPGTAIYIRDDDIGALWSPTPQPIREKDAYRTRHGQGYTRFEHNSHAIEQRLLTFVPVDDAGGLPVRLQRLRLRNNSSRRRKLTVTSYARLVLGSDPEETGMHVVTKWDLQSQSLFARNSFELELSERVAFASSTPAPASFTGDRAAFIGRNRSLRDPAAMGHRRLTGDTGAGLDPCAAVQLTVEIDPNQTTEITFLLGQADDEEKARALVQRFRDPDNVESAFQETCRWWHRLLSTIEVETPELSTNFLLNRWLLYQTLSCRLWGRTGLYQSSGAYGFRDQLQDVMALVHAAPQLARHHILRAAARQFLEGDVQHWWHPDSGAGVRTRVSDDLLWLPFVTAHYVRTTGDDAILDETVPFLEAKPLEAQQTESFSSPVTSHTDATLLEHCRRAIAHSATAGPHGLPLIGGGDWNDGLNHVGLGGKGESVWLAWFQICALNDFTELLALRELHDEAKACRARVALLAKTVDAQAWDGEWYRRGYFDDGTPFGSRENAEARIDSLPQTWAAISGAGDSNRVDVTLRSLEENLVREADDLILLFAPPFDKTTADVGYIKAYPPGVRENGGQYTHAATWVAMAFARQGNGDKAVRLLRMLNPVEHARDEKGCQRYKVEPYVMPGDVYSLAGRVGRGGWTWYTGAAAWTYRVWLEEILGFQRRGNSFTINPVIPKDWLGFRLRYRFQNTIYRITVENPEHCSRGVTLLELDGVVAADKIVTLRDDALSHQVRVVLGTKSPA
ncbi:MAG TPA: glucoamylase family protein [Chthoniobacterales bacterium]|jgi:cyclic beta-1,2-glucan synthetase|nr:glucoamylase family protein [Chthoniobacterales bacterium]